MRKQHTTTAPAPAPAVDVDAIVNAATDNNDAVTVDPIEAVIAARMEAKAKADKEAKDADKAKRDAEANARQLANIGKIEEVGAVDRQTAVARAVENHGKAGNVVNALTGLGSLITGKDIRKAVKSVQSSVRDLSTAGQYVDAASLTDVRNLKSKAGGDQAVALLSKTTAE